MLAESRSRGRGLHLDTSPSDANLDASFIVHFHSVLARDVFAGLPAGGVTIMLTLETQTPLSTSATLSKVSSIFECYFTPLFSPWLSRGILRFDLTDWELSRAFHSNVQAAASVDTSCGQHCDAVG